MIIEMNLEMISEKNRNLRNKRGLNTNAGFISNHTYIRTREKIE